MNEQEVPEDQLHTQPHRPKKIEFENVNNEHYSRAISDLTKILIEFNTNLEIEVTPTPGEGKQLSETDQMKAEHIVN